jgi:hypothetical protein
LFHTFEVAVCLLVDLDRDDHDRWDGSAGVERYYDLIEDLDKRVGDIYSADCGVEHDQFRLRGEALLAAQATFTHDTHAPESFDVLAFRSSLEDAAGIGDDDGDDGGEEAERLNAFLTANPEPFDRVL